MSDGETSYMNFRATGECSEFREWGETMSRNSQLQLAEAEIENVHETIISGDALSLFGLSLV